MLGTYLHEFDLVYIKLCQVKRIIWFTYKLVVAMLLTGQAKVTQHECFFEKTI